jgi:hypothetical protein
MEPGSLITPEPVAGTTITISSNLSLRSASERDRSRLSALKSIKMIQVPIPDLAARSSTTNAQIQSRKMTRIGHSLAVDFQAWSPILELL